MVPNAVRFTELHVFIVTVSDAKRDAIVFNNFNPKCHAYVESDFDCVPNNLDFVEPDAVRVRVDDFKHDIHCNSVADGQHVFVDKSELNKLPICIHGTIFNAICNA